MTHSHKHPKSKYEWFRMDVPERLRALAGTTSWRKSLGTTDKNMAAIKRADLTAFYKAETIRLDGVLAGMETQKARDLVDRALELLAARKGSLDLVIRALLTFLTLRARQSWSRDHERDARWDFGLVFCEADDDDDVDEVTDPLPGFDSDEDRDAYVTRQRLIERRGLADGITLQEVAQRLLDRQAWPHVYADLLGVLDLVGVELQPSTPKYDAAAEHFLRRLAEHRFDDWQPQIREAITPLAALAAPLTSSAAPAPSPSTVVTNPPVPIAGKGHPISEVFADWRAHSKATEKTKDEFGRGIRLFIAHHGDLPVEMATKRIVTEWKKLLVRLPAQAKADVTKLPPLEQATRAEIDGLRCLSGRTATKYLQAIRSTLKHARDEMLIIEGELATQGVTIDVSDDEKIDVQPFNEEQMTLIFSDPLMTDPQVGDDEMFWFLLLAPFSGCRIEETAQLRPTNIRTEKNIDFIAIERDRIAERRKIAEAGGIKKRLKTKMTTKRNIPINWILAESGFIEFVNIMKERGADWLFDDLVEYKKYDQRGKYMSNKVMRFLRRIGIEDRENVYHSFRHTLKREQRDDEQTKEEISDLLTGHSFSESVGRKYARGAGLNTLAAAVNRVDYNTVDWDKVVAAGRARVSRMRFQQAA